MADDEFDQSTIEELNKYADKLKQLYQQVDVVSKRQTRIENESIFAAVSEAAHGIESAIEFYGDEDAIPWRVRKAMRHALKGIVDLSTVMIAHSVLSN
jgi:hypothetical protein